MAKLTFRKAIVPIQITIKSDYVAMLMGERGIGKTSLAKHIAEQLDAHFIAIDANLLKEGEIGGLPTAVVSNDSTMLDYLAKIDRTAKKRGEEEHTKLFKMILKKYKEEVSNPSSKEAVTRYAVHYTIQQMWEWYNENPDKTIVCLIDEFNRCEHAVQQELMNMILNRNLNGKQLPPNVRLLAAANPSSKYSEFRDTAYQVNDMDEAQEDRFRWFFLGVDVPEWLDWGTRTNKKLSRQNIHDDVLEFIAENNDLLCVTGEGGDDIKPSNRSWERFSNSYWDYIDSTKKPSTEIINIIGRGDVGPTVTSQFINFLKNRSNPLIKPEEIFVKKGNVVPAQVMDKLKNESIARLVVSVKKAINYYAANSKKDKQRMTDILENLIVNLPKDVMRMIMATIMENNKSIHNSLMDSESYVDTFFEVDSMV